MTHLINNIYAIEVPEHPIVLDEGWRILFTTQGASEEDWKGVVEREGDSYLDYILFRGHLQNYFDTATLSGASLLSSKGLDTNKNYCLIEKMK